MRIWHRLKTYFSLSWSRSARVVNFYRNMQKLSELYDGCSIFKCILRQPENAFFENLRICCSSGSAQSLKLIEKWQARESRYTRVYENCTRTRVPYALSARKYIFPSWSFRCYNLQTQAVGYRILRSGSPRNELPALANYRLHVTKARPPSRQENSFPDSWAHRSRSRGRLIITAVIRSAGSIR